MAAALGPPVTHTRPDKQRDSVSLFVGADGGGGGGGGGGVDVATSAGLVLRTRMRKNALIGRLLRLFAFARLPFDALAFWFVADDGASRRLFLFLRRPQTRLS
jgi:hypothetical protein